MTRSARGRKPAKRAQRAKSVDNEGKHRVEHARSGRGAVPSPWLARWQLSPTGIQLFGRPPGEPQGSDDDLAKDNRGFCNRGVGGHVPERGDALKPSLTATRSEGRRWLRCVVTTHRTTGSRLTRIAGLLRLGRQAICLERMANSLGSRRLRL
jgi:hypothetical protein